MPGLPPADELSALPAADLAVRLAEACRLIAETAPAIHADETPARAAGGTRYVHLACTAYLTCMHTGDRRPIYLGTDR